MYIEINENEAIKLKINDFEGIDLKAFKTINNTYLVDISTFNKIKDLKKVSKYNDLISLDVNKNFVTKTENEAMLLLKRNI